LRTSKNAQHSIEGFYPDLHVKNFCRTKSPDHDRRSKRRDGGPRDVRAVLERLSLHKYVGAFQAHEIDLEAFVELNNDDLIEMGVERPAARKKLLAEIRRLK
jgi:hypothetical protein